MSVTDEMDRAEAANGGLYWVTMGATGVVALVCVVVSYVHAHEVVARAFGPHAGRLESALAWAVPVVADGAGFAGSARLIYDARSHRAGSNSAKLAAALGLVASLAANLFAVIPEWAPDRHVQVAVALYPVVVLAILAHLALESIGMRSQAVARHEPPSAPQAAQEPPPAAVTPEPPAPAVAVSYGEQRGDLPALVEHTGPTAEHGPPAPTQRPEPAQPRRRPTPIATASVGVDDPPTEAETRLWRQLAEAKGKAPGSPTLHKAAKEAGVPMTTRRAQHLAKTGQENPL